MTTRIPIARPQLGDEEWQALRAPIEDGWLTQGPRVAAFEAAFAARHGAAHAVAVSSGTAGLHLALAALGVGPGDEVIVPSFTWVATANAARFLGASPVLCDVDRRTYNVDPASLRARLSARTRAIIAVHLFGLPADLEAIAAAAPGVPLVEDAACAAGAARGGRPVGALGALGVFSFHPRKTISTGEGGMVTTNDPALAERVARLRNHAGPRFEEVGWNYRLTDLQAAVGLVQLGKLDRFLDERAALAAAYRRDLAGVGWLRAPDDAPAGDRHGWQSYVSWVEGDRDGVMRQLAARGVDTRAGTHAVHLLPAYAGSAAVDLPAARDCDRQTLALPFYNGLSPADQARVVEAVISSRP